MVALSLWFIALPALLDRPIQCYPRRIGQCNRAFGAIACALQLSDLSRMTAKDHDHVAVMFETVISGHGLGMLRDNQRAFMVTRFA
jgi:hypothetical protein